MDWRNKYAGNIVVLNRLEKNEGIAAILMAISSLLRKEEFDYSIDILGDFCQFFMGKDKGLMLEQLQRFAENGWFLDDQINHCEILNKVIFESESKLIKMTSAHRRRDF